MQTEIPLCSICLEKDSIKNFCKTIKLFSNIHKEFNYRDLTPKIKLTKNNINFLCYDADVERKVKVKLNKFTNDLDITNIEEDEEYILVFINFEQLSKKIMSCQSLFKKINFKILSKKNRNSFDYFLKIEFFSIDVKINVQHLLREEVHTKIKKKKKKNSLEKILNHEISLFSKIINFDPSSLCQLIFYESSITIKQVLKNEEFEVSNLMEILIDLDKQNYNYQTLKKYLGNDPSIDFSSEFIINYFTFLKEMNVFKLNIFFVVNNQDNTFIMFEATSEQYLSIQFWQKIYIEYEKSEYQVNCHNKKIKNVEEKRLSEEIFIFNKINQKKENDISESVNIIKNSPRLFSKSKKKIDNSFIHKNESVEESYEKKNAFDEWFD